MTYRKVFPIVKEYFLILLGTVIMACSTANFMVLNQLSTGGFSGIATIGYYLFKIPVGTITFVMNIPLILFAFFRINKGLCFKSIIGTFFLSFFIDEFEKMGAITNDRFLACIYGGILTGIGTAIILKAGASTGGTDLLSYVIKSYNNKYRSSRLILIADAIIIVLNMLFFRTIEIGLYSVISIYIMGKLIDIVFEGFYFTKVMFIISDQHEEIARIVGKEVKRGSTGIYAKGMYSQCDKVMLFCVASRKEISEIKSIVNKIDKNAFIVTADAMETLGRGFSN